jgi:hypothetical protein
MRAPPAIVKEPITIRQLRKIIAGLGDRYNKMMPPDDALTRLAVVLTARQPQYDLPPEQQWENLGFPMHLTDVLGNEYIIKAPLLPLGVSLPGWPEHAFGHPRYDKPTTWRDLARDMAADFHGAMGCTFDRRRATARFLEKVIPLVTGETPSATAIGQWLVQPRPRARPRKRIRQTGSKFVE